MNGDEKSRVEGLNDVLYSRTRYKDPNDKRSEVKELETPDVVEKWQSPSLDEMLTHERVVTEVKPFMKKFFVFALLFFVATILVAGFVFMGGANFISSKNVDIEVVGPTLASAGEVLDLAVTISNKNNSDLEPAFFSVQYPSGSRDPEDTSKSLTYTKTDLKVVGAGDESVQNVRLALIGSIGEVKELKFSVEYKVKGSNATFYKDKIYEVTIGDSPLTLTIESPGSVTSGETFTTNVVVSHKSTEVLRNVMLRGEYPYGYSVTGATPEAIADNNVWSLGDLSPGATKRIAIQGRLLGEDQDERTMRFYAGVSDNSSLNPNFKTIILSTQKTLAIERPFLELFASFNGENTETYVAPAGQPIATNLRFTNNLPEKIINPKLEVRLTGNALNKESVLPLAGGVYNESNNQLNWILAGSQGIAELSPGESGVVSFNFASIPEEALMSGSREIGLQLILTGTPVGDPQPLTVTERRTVKIASQVTLSSKALYSVAPFVANTGPIPPQVGKETTYTVIWTIGNTQSDLHEAKVTAKLGNGVKWVNVHSTESENASYDATNNTITWDLGTLMSGTGFSTPPREIIFQIALTPSPIQVGIAPVLVNNISFSAYDRTLNKPVTVNNPAVSTRLTSDPAFIQGDDIVVK